MMKYTYSVYCCDLGGLNWITFFWPKSATLISVVTRVSLIPHKGNLRFAHFVGGTWPTLPGGVARTPANARKGE